MWRMTDLFEKDSDLQIREKKMFQLKRNTPKSNRNSEMSAHRNLQPFKCDWAMGGTGQTGKLRNFTTSSSSTQQHICCIVTFSS